MDADLADHLVREGVDYVQFAFRWVNCLLQREVPLALSLRLWDTYLVRCVARGEGGGWPMGVPRITHDEPWSATQRGLFAGGDACE